METKYEYLVGEYARVRASVEYIRVMKLFDAEQYKNNKAEIDNLFNKLGIESNKLLTDLEKLINDKESV
jgi:hypothetical protein|nr:MAG TPA: hypothetical protein [Caudoviricetes sp.]